MSVTTRARLATTTPLVACAIAFALASTPAFAATTVIHFQHESLPALEAQLAKHEVHALAFHPTPAPGHVHVSLNNGQHMTVVYAPAEQAQLEARAKAVGTPYAIAVAKSKTASKASHHKLRYIAAGLVILVIIVVTAVLLVDRRRRVNEGQDGAPAAPSSSDAG